MPDDSIRPPRVSLIHLATAALVLVVAIVVWVLPRFAGNKTTPTASPAPDWQPRTAGRLSLEAPFALKAGPSLLDRLPREIRERVTSLDSFEGSAGSFRLQVTRCTYRPGVELDLDGAATSSVTSAAKSVGDGNPKYTVSPTRVGSLEGRHLSCTLVKDLSFYEMEAVIFRDGQDLWQVLATRPSNPGDTSAARVLRSIRLADR